MSEGDNFDSGMFEYSLCAGTFLHLGNKKFYAEVLKYILGYLIVFKRALNKAN